MIHSDYLTSAILLAVTFAGAFALATLLCDNQQDDDSDDDYLQPV